MIEFCWNCCRRRRCRSRNIQQKQKESKTTSNQRVSGRDTLNRDGIIQAIKLHPEAIEGGAVAC